MMQESGEATANNPISAYVYNYLKHKFSTESNTGYQPHAVVEPAMAGTWGYLSFNRNR